MSETIEANTYPKVGDLTNQFEKTCKLFNVAPKTKRRNYIVQTCLRHFHKYIK
jgi:hypothetical protein